MDTIEIYFTFSLGAPKKGFGDGPFLQAPRGWIFASFLYSDDSSEISDSVAEITRILHLNGPSENQNDANFSSRIVAKWYLFHEKLFPLRHNSIFPPAISFFSPQFRLEKKFLLIYILDTSKEQRLGLRGVLLSWYSPHSDDVSLGGVVLGRPRKRPQP